VVSHALALAFLLALTALLPERVYEPVLPEPLPATIVWLPDPGPGGGGGGGKQGEEPPQAAELPGDEAITVPAPDEEPVPEPQPEPVEPPPVQTLTIAALETASSSDTVVGGLESSQVSASLDSGRGDGVGADEGDGLGPGAEEGTGGGPSRPGNGVLEPRLLRQVEPRYTADAMLAKVQGHVWLDCVVLPDGTVGDVEIVRSLDSTFGLDREAVRAVRQWRFRPGTRNGMPVAVLVTIELSFTLR
jgi:TonB family protein